jgi:hypothetical protein
MNMATRKFALVEGGEKRLEIVQPSFSQTRVVKLDGKLISEIPDLNALKAGREYPIGDGQTLSIRYFNNWLTKGLDVRLDGEPIPGSDTHPQKQLSNACGAILFIAAVNIIVGLITITGNGDFLGLSGLNGRENIISGVTYAVLAYFVYRRSQIALGLALAGFVIDTVILVLSVNQLIKNSDNPGIYGGLLGGFFIRLFLAGMMIQGFLAIRKLKAEKDSTA